MRKDRDGGEREERKVGKNYLNVCHSVVIEVGGGCEAFPTRRTLVRLFSGMNTPMSI